MTPTQVDVSDTNRRTGRPAWLSPLAAAAYEACRRDGMPGGCVSDAGRTYAEQEAMYADYLAGKLTATAARPGTSKHETGTAIDLAEPARAWMRARGGSYGWIADRVANEPWHFEHDGRVLTPAPIAPPPAPRDWFDMATEEQLRQIVRAEIAAALPRVRTVVIADVDGIGACIVDIGARTYQPIGPGRLQIALALGLDYLKAQGVAFISGFTKLPG